MTALVVSRKQRLRTLENEIRTGLESFIQTGMKLKAIRDDELFKEDGFETWEKYCKDRWDWTPGHVRRVITASEYRAVLPSVPIRHAERKTDWTETQIRELTRIPDKRHAATVAKKVIAEVEKNPELNLTSTLVRKFVNQDLGITNDKPKESKP